MSQVEKRWGGRVVDQFKNNQDVFSRFDNTSDNTLDLPDMGGQRRCDAWTALLSW